MFSSGEYGTDDYGRGVYGTATVPGTFAMAVYNQLNLDDILSDYPIAAQTILQFIGALGAMFQQVDTLAHPSIDTDGNQAASWTQLIDVDRIPDEGIPWFAQFTGVSLNPNYTVAQQRQQIRDRMGWKRGTPAAMAAVIQSVLTGTKTVQFVERDTSPYHFNVATYSDETPSSDAVIAAVVSSKPAGLQFTYTEIPGSPATADSYENLYIDYGSYMDVYSVNETYQDVYINP
jgi:hypothetical protein